MIFLTFVLENTVRVHARIVEGTRERIQIFEGVVIKRRGQGISEMYTVRKVSNGVGVERTFPLHSPRVANLEVTRQGRVRRAKLYYLRNSYVVKRHVSKNVLVVNYNEYIKRTVVSVERTVLFFRINGIFK